MTPSTPVSNSADTVSPFEEIDRADWARLAGSMTQPLTAAEIEQLRGIGELLDMTEVEEVYLPLSRLVNMYAAGLQRLRAVTRSFLDREEARTPFVIGIAGSVAVGKSTIARLLRELLSRWETTPHVELVTTDGFLYPNAELERRGIAARKGFPESYDRRALLRFVTQVKSGAAEVRAPHYSHLVYDIVPGRETVVHRPDVLIVEGLNVLQPASAEHPLAVSDLFDFSIYVDARADDIREWFTQRFLRLQSAAFSDPDSFFRRFAELSEQEARATALHFWRAINEPNLRDNILPTRSRATLVLRKEADHRVQKVLLRKL